MIIGGRPGKLTAEYEARALGKVRASFVCCLRGQLIHLAGALRTRQDPVTVPPCAQAATALSANFGHVGASECMKQRLVTHPSDAGLLQEPQ